MWKVKQSRSDRVFDFINLTLLVIIFIIMIYPLYIVVISSVSSAQAVNAGDVKFWPVGFNIQGYKYIFDYRDIWMGYRNTIIYTFFGTALNVALTLMAGYALSRKDLKGRNVIMVYFVFTMYFSGGLIPSYILVNNLGLYNTPYLMIILGAVSMGNLIITRSFFMMTIPYELFEAATIDGCGDFKYFTKIALPLSQALITVMILYYGVAHWNSFFNALIYLSKRTLYPVQVFLRNVLLANQQISIETGATWEEIEERRKYAEAIKYGLIVVASFPLLSIYPFLQRYFIKGIMIGSLKG